MCHLAQMVVGEAQLLDRAGIGRVELEDIPVLEDCLPVLLSRDELVAALQMASFRASGDREHPATRTSPTRRSAAHPHVVRAIGYIVSIYLTDVGCRTSRFLITQPCC